MLENRRHTRIRNFLDVAWDVPGELTRGQGRIINISSSGVLLQIDDSFEPLNKTVLAINPDLPEDEQPLPFKSKQGKIVWFRKIQTPRFKYQCGVEFLEGSDMDKNLSDWIENKLSNLSVTMNTSILNNYVA